MAEGLTRALESKDKNKSNLQTTKQSLNNTQLFNDLLSPATLTKPEIDSERKPKNNTQKVSTVISNTLKPPIEIKQTIPTADSMEAKIDLIITKLNLLSVDIATEMKEQLAGLRDIVQEVVEHEFKGLEAA